MEPSNNPNGRIIHGLGAMIFSLMRGKIAWSRETRSNRNAGKPLRFQVVIDGKFACSHPHDLLNCTRMTQSFVAPTERYKFRHRHWVRWFVVATILPVAVVRLRLLNLPLERDEGEYAYAGQLMLQGVPPLPTCRQHEISRHLRGLRHHHGRVRADPGHD